MSIQAQPASFRRPERRRSERLPFRETLFVCGRSEGRSFKEETITLFVSATGALVALSAKVSVGQRVLLMNPQTWEEREGHVRRLGHVENERTQVAIEFTEPAPEFWPIRARLKSVRVHRGLGAPDLDERIALQGALRTLPGLVSHPASSAEAGEKKEIA